MSETINVIDRVSTHGIGSPLSKTINLGYDKIDNALLKVQLLGSAPSTVAGAPAYLGGGYKLLKVVVNGRTFFPSDPQNSTNLIQDVNALDKNFHNTLISNGENTFEVFFDSPFGAGVISQDAQINAQLIINGTKNALGNLGITSLPSISDLGSQFQTFLSNNTPVAITILVMITIIIIAIAFLVSRLPNFSGVKV